MHLPNKKITNYVEQQSGSELLIYDLSTDQAFCLNETAAMVFAACDGKTSFEVLEKRSKISSELIGLTLDELRKCDLIESDYSSAFIGINRREVIRRVGLASMVALPVISSLVAPSAANAASAGRLFSACNSAGDCGGGANSCNRITSGSQAGSRVCCINATARGGTNADFLGGDSAKRAECLRLLQAITCRKLLQQSGRGEQLYLQSVHRRHRRRLPREMRIREKPPGQQQTLFKCISAE